MKLLGDKVAVVECVRKDRKERGLYLPQDHIQTIFEATVRFIGSELSEPDIKVGDKVLVKIYDSSPKIRFNDEELRIYDTDKVIALVH